VFNARIAWLVGDGPQLELIDAALQRHGCRVERILATEIDAVLETIRRGALALLPNLIVLTREAAAPDGGAPLDTLASRSPWRLVPLVVISGVEDVAGCRRAYAAGASSWTVLPDEDAEPLAESFARYWLETAMLPSPVLPA